MNFISIVLTINLLISFSSEITAKIFNVKNYGAVPSQKTDINKALLSAWKDGCAAEGASEILIPDGNYALRQIDLVGPCMGSVTVNIQGTITASSAPGELRGDSWITFEYIDHLTLRGGILDAKVKNATGQNTCPRGANCKSLPTNIRFDYVTNSIVQNLTSLDSKNFHINVLRCKNLTLQHVKIVAPENHTNTDGVHIGRSVGINILDTKIQTGDDCISIGEGSKQVKIMGVECGPGNGISVGTLGKHRNEQPVSGVYVNKCTLSRTTNGLRITSSPGLLYGSTASDLHFEDITMNDVQNAILIDQMYCTSNQCNDKSSSKVKISKISFKNITGTTTTPVIVKLLCSKNLPCEDVELSGISIKYKGNEGPARSECKNVEPKISFRTDGLRGC